LYNISKLLPHSLRIALLLITFFKIFTISPQLPQDRKMLCKKSRTCLNFNLRSFARISQNIHLIFNYLIIWTLFLICLWSLSDTIHIRQWFIRHRYELISIHHRFVCFPLPLLLINREIRFRKGLILNLCYSIWSLWRLCLHLRSGFGFILWTIIEAFFMLNFYFVF
jgi:hypothetical protein